MIPVINTKNNKQYVQNYTPQRVSQTDAWEEKEACKNIWVSSKDETAREVEILGK